VCEAAAGAASANATPMRQTASLERIMTGATIGPREGDRQCESLRRGMSVRGESGPGTPRQL
jgi:hypothetical protein